MRERLQNPTRQSIPFGKLNQSAEADILKFGFDMDDLRIHDQLRKHWDTALCSMKTISFKKRQGSLVIEGGPMSSFRGISGGMSVAGEVLLNRKKASA